MKRPKIDFIDIQMTNQTPITADTFNHIYKILNGVINRVNDLEQERPNRDLITKITLFIELLTIILIILKLTNVIHNWLIVLSPLLMLSIITIVVVNVMSFKKH